MILEQTAARQTKLLSLLRREFGLSAGLVKRLKWQNALFVNGAPAHTDCPVQPGDRVRVVLEEQTEGFDPEPMPLSILYEDPYFLAVDKPAGMLVHPSPQKNSGTLANGVLYHLQQSAAGAGVHPVTRLDRDTFGVVLLAKNANVHDRFCRLLREKQLEKTYLASVFGHPPQDAGEIDLPVYKIGGGNLIRIVDERGQKALTQYRVLERAEKTALLELHPLTGRTHQLRLHCMASGFPILGDPQYASPESTARSAQLGLTHQLLCAARLALTHPVTGEQLTLRSAYRLELQKLVARPPQDVYNVEEQCYGATPQR